MKTKVLFTAALMAAAASGAQAAMNAGSNMLVQLLESQRFEGVSLLADEDKVRPEQDNTDVTEWIVNPSFDENTMDGWTSTVNFGFWGATGPNVGTPEVYNAAFEAYQDLSGLPNGKYAVSVQAWANRGRALKKQALSNISGHYPKYSRFLKSLSGDLMNLTILADIILPWS